MKSSILKPTKNDQKLAKQLIDLLKGQKNDLRFNSLDSVLIRIADNETVIQVPGRVFDLWIDVIKCISDGTGVSIIRSASYLSTQEAADLLNISRPSIVKLIESGDLPCKKIGSHRRISLSDLEHYQMRTRESTLVKLGIIICSPLF